VQNISSIQNDLGCTSPRSNWKKLTFSLGKLVCSYLSSANNLLRNALDQKSPNFLSEGHISYYTTVRESDMLRNVIVSGCHIRPNKQNLSKMYHFYYWKNGLAGRLWRADSSLETLALNPWLAIKYLMTCFLRLIVSLEGFFIGCFYATATIT